MRKVEIAPAASSLLQSLRGLGYSPETALADIVDNSISADAEVVEIVLDWNEGQPRVQVLDDGQGLDAAMLEEAMRFGGDGPGAARDDGDLGRFGLGLKTASLSQCRLLTVASRRDGVISCLAWDIDEVARRRRWEALVPDHPSPSDLATALEARPAGTLVTWDRMDALGGLYGLDKETFFQRLTDIRAHLAMVFHRFLDGDARKVRISVNGRPVRAWDPFLQRHPATRVMAAVRRSIGGRPIVIRPFVLPHRDRFETEEDFLAAGGPGGWTERQGFYVYRGGRLVVAGGWLGLGGSRAWTRDEASRLARIAIDLPTDLDESWRIDIRKSVARPPAELRPRLTAIATACRANAREVFAWRGGTSRRKAPVSPEAIWSGRMVDGRARYRINRDHPALARIIEALGARAPELETALALIEKTVPVEQIWLDVSEQTEVSQALTDTEIAEMAPGFAALVRSMDDGDTPLARLEKLLRPLRFDSPVLRLAVIAILDAKP